MGSGGGGGATTSTALRNQPCAAVSRAGAATHCGLSGGAWAGATSPAERHDGLQGVHVEVLSKSKPERYTNWATDAFEHAWVRCTQSHSVSVCWALRAQCCMWSCRR